MSVPKQYKLTIKKPKIYSDAFYTGNRKNTNEAYRLLTPSGFGMYMWLLQNQSGYSFDLYSVQAEKDLGFSARTYDRAISDLKANGYLVKRATDAKYQYYDFYDAPQPQE